MRNAFFKRALPFVALTALALASLPAFASTYDSLVVFGDSLSDSGNNALVIGSNAAQSIPNNGYVPTQPYGSGVYSNGPVWASDVATSLGVTLTPSLAGGTNYAFGGATTGPLVTTPTLAHDFPYSLMTQATQYLTTHPVADANALYVIAGGGNDARATLGALAARLLTETDVLTFDIFGLGSLISGNPGAYGFTNVADACGSIVAANCATYAYWDGIHPTAAAHEVIAQAFLTDIGAVPEPSTWAMMILGFAGIAFVAYRRRNQGQVLGAA